jgi:small-conductance mechanosensitive channel
VLIQVRYNVRLMADTVNQLQSEFNDVFSGSNAMRSLIILLISLAAAFLLSKVVALGIIRIAQFVATISDNAPDAERQVRLRRIETYLSVAIALVRSVIIGIFAFYTWNILSPNASTGAATIGASAFFVVLAGGTISVILRDVTAGASMIIEGWFHVGDYIDIEPFENLSGVVERMTLRSTKLRSLSGEIVWIHNQYMNAVKVTPHGLRTIAVDVFVNNQGIGRKMIEKAIATMPTGTLKVIKTPEIAREEQWGEHLWLFTVVGQTAPGREWLMENYFVESVRELDDRRKGPQTMVRPPIVRYADPEAERSFKRAVRMATKEANKA